MLVYQVAPNPVDCRTVVVPLCDTNCDTSQSASIAALALFQMRLRDKLDFTVDFSAWLVKNGSPTLTDAEFAAAADSPSSPVIEGQAFAPTGKCVVVLSVPEDAKAGDAYYLDVTAEIAATQAVSPGDVAIPARTLVRRIHVVVVNG